MFLHHAINLYFCTVFCLEIHIQSVFTCLCVVLLYFVQCFRYLYLLTDLQLFIQQSLPLPDPLMSGHLLCRDTISMYELFYHVNVPLMRGHLVDADSGQDFWFSFPAKADIKH